MAYGESNGHVMCARAWRRWPPASAFSSLFSEHNRIVSYRTRKYKLLPLNVHQEYIVWVKKIIPWNFLTFSPNGWEFLVQILNAYYTFLSTLDYRFLFNYLQLFWSYAIVSATTIMCSKCPPSTETHAGWSRLIWHNFVEVAGNWIKIRSLA